MFNLSNQEKEITSVWYYCTMQRRPDGIRESKFLSPTLTKSFDLLSMINETVSRGRSIFAYLINQSTGASNGIFKHFKLGIDKESKAFKRTRNWKRSTHNKLHKRVS